MAVRRCNPFHMADFYKIAHRIQYPPGTEFVYSTWIPRSTYLDGVSEVVAFGFQAFIQKYLIDYFNEEFFNKNKEEVLADYARVIRYTLGDPDPDVSHLAYLHDLGYLPLLIKAVPEGTKVPLRVPMLTIENTDPKCFWLTNALETLFSTECWLPSTSATIAARFREMLNSWCEETGGDPEFVPFQGHDFSMRGMSSVESGATSGAAHLLSFVGTDSIPAIVFHENYYGADIEKELVGTSIPATEHSVMCTYGRDELAAYKRLMTDVYPNGFLSVVSDTYNLWDVLTKVLPPLKETILNREGKIVIRPDSGDPVEIICGGPRPFGSGDHLEPSEKGVIELLWDLFGGTINAKGYKVLDPHIGCIYGDAINYQRADEICRRLAAKGFASTNIVFGIGSFTYQWQTRDSLGFALKATHAIVKGEEINIFKDPATDVGKTKKSLTGRVIVHEREGKLVVVDGLDRAGAQKYSDDLDDLLDPVFCDGQLLRFQSLQDIRERLTAYRIVA